MNVPFEPLPAGSTPNADTAFTNAFRKRIWRFGVKLPHQGTRECARRSSQGKRA